jgi:predicted heme/steroid binding protein
VAFFIRVLGNEPLCLKSTRKMAGIKIAQLSEKITKERGHHAGRDLTTGLREGPHGEDMLERVVLIGTLHEE